MYNPALAIVVRTTARKNSKPRPAWFDKVACACSLKAAVQQLRVPVSVDIVVDEHFPEGTGEIYRGFAAIHGTKAGNNRRSLLAAIDVARRRAADGAELILLCEDDYLFLPNALTTLLEAHAEYPQAYIAPYVPDDREWHRKHPSQPLTPPKEASRIAISSSGRFRSITHTTSTFAVPGDVLARDHTVMRTVAYVGAPIAHATCATLQGIAPFDLRFVLHDLNLTKSPRAWLNATVRVVMRVIANIAARWMKPRSRMFIAPAIDVATHVESGYLTPGKNWRQVSEQALTLMTDTRPSG